MSGYLLNNLMFYSKTGLSTYDNTDWPISFAKENCVLKNNPVWNFLSKNFAQKQSGYVSLVLNGANSNKNPPFYRSSTFNMMELPELKHIASKISNINLILTHPPGEKVLEICSNGKSIQEVTTLAAPIQVKCKEREPQFVFLLCSYNPGNCTSMKIPDPVISG